MKKILAFIRPYTAALLLTIGIGTAGSFLNILVPNRIEEIAGLIQDGIGSGLALPEIMRLGLICGGIIVGMFLCSYYYNWRIEKIAQLVGRDIRRAVNAKLNRTALIELDRVAPGDLIACTGSDVEHISIAISKSIGPLLINVILLFGAVILMMIRSVPLALCVLVSTVLGALACILISLRVLPMQMRLREELSAINTQVGEAVSGFAVIEAYNAEREILETFHTTNEAYTGHLRKAQFFSNMLTPFMGLIRNVTFVVICLVGSVMMMRGDPGISFGVIVAFILYARMIAAPLEFFSGVMSMLSETRVSAKKIAALLDLPENRDDGEKHLAAVRGQVSFHDVRFGYLKDREILHGFSAELQPGMKVAIVGPTGAGKTTLVNLLMRFYEADSGSIRIDGTDIRDLPREELHAILGMVMQETFLFNASIRENIEYAAGPVPEEALMRVIDQCSLTQLVRTLPNGLDTILSEEASVSAGQRQLITIARTMLKDPAILILDEATSSVDTRTELLIQQALDQLSRGRTSFVIAHRLSTIRNADLIFVLRDGDIVETGTHAELLKRNGVYANLYYSQFEES